MAKAIVEAALISPTWKDVASRVTTASSGSADLRAELGGGLPHQEEAEAPVGGERRGVHRADSGGGSLAAAT